MLSRSPGANPHVAIVRCAVACRSTFRNGGLRASPIKSPARPAAPVSGESNRGRYPAWVLDALRVALGGEGTRPGKRPRMLLEQGRGDGARSCRPRREIRRGCRARRRHIQDHRTMRQITAPLCAGGAADGIVVGSAWRQRAWDNPSYAGLGLSDPWTKLCADILGVVLARGGSV